MPPALHPACRLASRMHYPTPEWADRPPAVPTSGGRMPILSQPAFGPKLSIAFITGGALIDVWDLVWFYTLAHHPLEPTQQFMFWGLLLTGVTFLIIGAFLGSIGRAARAAELPPTDETTRA